MYFSYFLILITRNEWMQLKQEYLALQKASMSSLKKAMAQIKTLTAGEMETDACIPNQPAARNGKCKENCEVLHSLCFSLTEEMTC